MAELTNTEIRVRLQRISIDIGPHMVFYPSGEVVQYSQDVRRSMGLWNGAAPRGPLFEFLAQTPKKRPLVLFQSDYDYVVAPSSETLRSTSSVISMLHKRYGEEVRVLAPSAWTGAPLSPITRLIPQYDSMFARGVAYGSLHSIPWKHKRDQVVWRGSSHDLRMGDRTNYPFLLRYSTVAALQGYERADVGFSRTLAFPHLHKPFMKPEEMCGSKALLCIDGWGWPGSLPWSLASKCVVLLVSAHATWISPRLRPWQHYIPVDFDIQFCRPGHPPFSIGPTVGDLETSLYDMTDVVEKLQWLWGHDDQARQIAECAYGFYVDHMNPAAQQAYLHGVLNE